MCVFLHRYKHRHINSLENSIQQKQFHNENTKSRQREVLEGGGEGKKVRGRRMKQEWGKGREDERKKIICHHQNFVTLGIPVI